MMVESVKLTAESTEGIRWDVWVRDWDEDRVLLITTDEDTRRKLIYICKKYPEIGEMLVDDPVSEDYEMPFHAIVSREHVRIQMTFDPIGVGFALHNLKDLKNGCRHGVGV